MTEMKFLSATAHRVAAVIAAASVTGLIATTAAFASSSAGSSGSVLAAAAVPAAVPACTARDLGAWVAVDQGNGAAGSIYYPLQFTNLSGHACALRGFPGVSAVDRNGHQLGSPAGWGSVTAPRTVVLAPGATAHAVLRWSDVEVTTAPGCDPVFTATELRVYPPGQYSATHAFFDLEVCSHAGPVYMHVGPILPGVGTING
jgi:hypothetical protein